MIDAGALARRPHETKRAPGDPPGALLVSGGTERPASGLAEGYLDATIHAPRATVRRRASAPDPSPTLMFVHSVYFWLNDDLSAERKAKFIEGIRSLTTIDCVREGFIGVPAATNREIIDASYSYALVLSFADAAAQDAYQVHPTHDAFRENCGGSWRKIVIYDAISA